jgi:hypothetical protein
MLFTLAKLAVILGLMFVGALTMYVTYRVSGGGMRGVARGCLTTILVFGILAFLAYQALVYGG